MNIFNFAESTFNLAKARCGIIAFVIYQLLSIAGSSQSSSGNQLALKDHHILHLYSSTSFVQKFNFAESGFNLAKEIS
jgi:hypothetical protein